MRTFASPFYRAFSKHFADVRDNITLQRLYGERRFDYIWFSDTRNPKLLVNEFAASDRIERHDLISNFQSGDLLYGTERERLKVREVIKLAGSLTFVTADEIHKVGSFDEKPFFGKFIVRIHFIVDNIQEDNQFTTLSVVTLRNTVSTAILILSPIARVRK